jgi:hypothetical protein
MGCVTVPGGERAIWKDYWQSPDSQAELGRSAPYLPDLVSSPRNRSQRSCAAGPKPARASSTPGGRVRDTSRFVTLRETFLEGQSCIVTKLELSR